MAECFANEDGERQIACEVAFQGEKMVIEISLIVIGYIFDQQTTHSILEAKVYSSCSLGTQTTPSLTKSPWSKVYLLSLHSNFCSPYRPPFESKILRNRPIAAYYFCIYYTEVLFSRINQSTDLTHERKPSELSLSIAKRSPESTYLWLCDETRRFRWRLGMALLWIDVETLAT